MSVLFSFIPWKLSRANLRIAYGLFVATDLALLLISISFL